MKNRTVFTTFICLALITAGGQATAEVHFWPPSQGGNGHCYEPVPADVTWAEANAAAEARGGYLATITSEAENTFVYNLLSDGAFWNGYLGPWLGGYQPAGSPEPAGGWSWVTGEGWTYSNWWPDGQPDNSGGMEHYLQFHGGPHPPGPYPGGPFWNDLSATNVVPGYVVEFGQDMNTCRLVTLPGREVHGVIYDAGHLWVTHSVSGVSDYTKIARLDPTTYAVLQESAELHWNGRGICVGEGSLWVTDALADRVHKVDPTTLQETGSFRTPGSEPCGIAFDGSHLWLTDPWAQRTYELSTSGAVVSSFSILNENRRGLEWDGCGLWTPTGDATVGFYTTSGQLAKTQTLGCLTSCWALYDIAINGSTWYVTAVPNGPTSVAGTTWGGLKAIYR